MREPTHCLPAAYRLFSESLGQIEDGDGLTEIATAIAMHYQQDVTREDVFSELDPGRMGKLLDIIDEFEQVIATTPQEPDARQEARFEPIDLQK